jgi:hypothetical protein
MAVSTGQDKPQRVAQGINNHLDLGAETLSAAAQSLGLLAPLFWGALAAQG